MTKKILAISLTAIFAITALAIPLGIAQADEHSIMVKVLTDNDTQFDRIVFKTTADLNLGSAFGYGIISDNNKDSVLVITTHAGILDSEAQIDADDALLHSHYVSLTKVDGSPCDEFEVEYISWQQPADVITRSHNTIMTGVPYTFSGTDSSDSGDEVDFVSSENITDIVTFTINPVGEAICIDDMTTIDVQYIRSSD